MFPILADVIARHWDFDVASNSTSIHTIDTKRVSFYSPWNFASIELFRLALAIICRSLDRLLHFKARPAIWPHQSQLLDILDRILFTWSITWHHVTSLILLGQLLDITWQVYIYLADYFNKRSKTISLLNPPVLLQKPSKLNLSRDHIYIYHHAKSHSVNPPWTPFWTGG